MLVSYLRQLDHRAYYCAVRSGATAAGVWAAIGKAIGAKGAIASHDELSRACAKLVPFELAIDCEGVPDETGSAAIARLIEEAPAGVALLIACRSRSALDAGRFVARGIGALCDAEHLAFNVAEIRQLAGACGVSFADHDAARLLEATDGWPHVVGWAIRKAREDKCDLAAAFDNWRRRRGHLFKEFVDAALMDAALPQASLVRKILAGFNCPDYAALEELEREGLFTIVVEHEFRPLRAISNARAHQYVRTRRDPRSPMQIQLLGWFRVELEGHPMKWIRRREQQIVKYLALRPHGSASRAELIATFWPDVDKQLASQSVRTACSNIRRAIAKIVGPEAVDEYFRANGEVSLNLNNVVVDVNQFLALADDGDEQYENGDLHVAYAHYRRAAELVRGRLLIGDTKEPWVAQAAAALDERHEIVRQRIAESTPDLTDRAIFESGTMFAY
ncbi:MAG: hypothetical protein JO113_02625, partial [Candidatus Eremiobacteraeota bacterium]|nr:hypothetical protein [Candidatus Eremiobacteraeota bacterium]